MAFMRSPASLDPGDHACLIYDDVHRRDAAIKSFLEAGFARGDRVVYVPETGDETVVGACEPNPKAGQLTVLDAEAAYTADGAFAPDRALDTLRAAVVEARALGYAALSAAGGPPASVTSNGMSAGLPDYERRVDEIVSEHEISAVCAYDSRVTEPRTLLGIVSAHPIVFFATRPDPRLRIDAGPHRLVLHGFLETATIGTAVPLLAEVLKGRADVTIDLSDLEFVDLSGVRLLVEAAGLLDDEGHSLVIEGTPSWLPSILDMVGFGDRRGLVVQ